MGGGGESMFSIHVPFSINLKGIIICHQCFPQIDQVALFPKTFSHSTCFSNF